MNNQQYPNVMDYGGYPQQQMPQQPCYNQQEQMVPIQPMPQQPILPQQPLIPTQPSLPNEQSYIENILRMNKGKEATVYMTFENAQWGSKIFKGIIEAAGKDHIILSDPKTGMRYLLLSIYLNYITFNEEINYHYPYPTSQFAKRDNIEK